MATTPDALTLAVQAASTLPQGPCGREWLIEALHLTWTLYPAVMGCPAHMWLSVDVRRLEAVRSVTTW